MENLTAIDLFSRPSPIECYKLNIIACYCILILIMSVTSNSILLIIFYKNKKLRTSLNMFIISITVLNLIGSISEFSFVIPSNFMCKWIFKKVGCHISGFIMYTVGCTHIYLTTAISVERFFIIYKPFSIRKISFKSTSIIIIFCILISVFWAACPFFGWSHYSLEGGLTSCSVEWAERNWNVYSYNVTIWIFAYIIPLIIIIYCNIHMILIIKKIPSYEETQKIENERKLTIIVMFYIGIFIITWTPYSIVSMWSAFVNPEDISPLGSTLPAMFAKSSMVWGTILYLRTNSRIRTKFNSNLFIKENESNSSMNRKNSVIKLDQIISHAKTANIQS